MINFIFILLISVEPKVLANRDYVPGMVELFDSSEKTIDIMMFSAGYYPTYPDGINQVLYKSLIRAMERGVKVRIILDASSWNPSNTRRNVMVADFFKRNGVEEVYFDPPEVTTHTKAMIVDSTKCVIGSTNWSFYALAHNNETSVLIESNSLAREMLRIFNDLLSVSTKELPPMEEEEEE
jgi:phosphatidylserine/phosphatidylglycerophosphate/cardiolipin synthase-like enzyme